MISPKQAATAQTLQQRETFTISLTKKKANYIKALLPLRYTLQIYSQRNDRNSSKSCHQSRKNSKSKNKEKNNAKLGPSDRLESRENVGQNAKDIKIQEIQQKQYLAALKQRTLFLPIQNQISLLKDSIMKFLGVMQNSLPNQKEKELENLFGKVRQNFQNNIYKNFLEFENQIKNIRDKISTESSNGKALKELVKIFKEIQTYFKCLSIKKEKQKQQSHKLQIEKQVSEKKLLSNSAKIPKSLKKNMKVVQKQLKSTNQKSKLKKKNVALPVDLFEVTQENQSLTNSTILIDSFEAARINKLLLKLHRYDQEQLLKTVGQKSGLTLIKKLSRKEADDLVTKIKRMMKKYGCEGLNDEKEIESSFQVESDE